MADKHSYGADSVGVPFILSSIAFFAAISAMVAQPLFSFLILRLGLEELVKANVWLIGPLNFTGFFAIYFIIFDHYLWQYISRIPRISGTWVGCTLPSYQSYPHLVIMRIEQTWSDISIVADVYYKTSPAERWQLSNKLGTDDSISASLSAMNNKQIDFTVVYRHEGEKFVANEINDGSQPSFSGTILASINLASRKYQMYGELFTDRPNRKAGHHGSFGKLHLERLSRKQIDPRRALVEARKRKILSRIENEIAVVRQIPRPRRSAKRLIKQVATGSGINEISHKKRSRAIRKQINDKNE